MATDAFLLGPPLLYLATSHNRLAKTAEKLPDGGAESIANTFAVVRELETAARHCDDCTAEVSENWSDAKEKVRAYQTLAVNAKEKVLIDTYPKLLAPLVECAASIDHAVTALNPTHVIRNDIANMQQKEMRTSLLQFPRSAETRKLMQAVQCYDDAHRVAVASLKDYRGGLVVLFKGDERFAKCSQGVSDGRKCLALCNLLQAMYNAKDDGRGNAVSDALEKCPTTGPYKVNATLVSLARAIIDAEQ